MKYYASLLLIVAFVASIATADDDDDESCKLFKPLQYELFGTKTIYGDARKYLSKEDDLPHSFDEDSLEKEHKDLVDDSCKPTVLYFIGRHSARFPDGEDIELYNRELNELKDKMRNLETVKKCPERFESFLNWTPRMQFRHDNLITDLGGREERDIARRLKKIYPEFFDTKKADVKIGVTTKTRTAQTGIEFLKEVNGLKLPNCEENSLPTNDLDKQNYDLDKILRSTCYKAIMENYALPFLEFHKTCEQIKGKEKNKEPLVEKVKDSLIVKSIAHRVARKLGLESGPNSPVDPELFASIYDMCKFENAYKNDSIWCSLFSKKDIQALEYIEDVKSYIKSAYGPNANSKQSCPLVKNLLENFQDGTKLNGTEREKRRAYFYFSHADPIKKLLASFGVFRNDIDFSEDRVQDFIDKFNIPKDREWRSSLIVPFSGNMVFVLYRCQEGKKPATHKILAAVTEQPVKLGGCKNTQCSSQRFFDTYENMKDCDLSKICAREQ